MKRALPYVLDYIKKADMFLLVLCLICSIYGIVLIWSSTRSFPGGGATPFLTVQIAALVLGLVCFVLFSIIDVEVIAQRWKLLLIFNIALLVSLVFFGTGLQGGARIWLRFFGIGIQPSELIKINFVVLMAYHIHYLKEYKKLNSLLSMAQLVIHFGFTFLLIPDIGNGSIFLIIFLVMLFLSGLKLRWFLFGGGTLAALIPFVWRFLEEHQRNRIMAPFDPTLDPTNLDLMFQVHRSRIAIASGQITGQGLGQGVQTQSGFVPLQWTDFIFSVVGEEFGLIGAIVVIVLLLAVIIRCFQVAAGARNLLSGLVAAGVGTFMLFQTVINIGMSLGLMPVIGLPLPFFSYGGSSLVSTFIAMGLVCGVHMRAVPIWRRPL